MTITLVAETGFEAGEWMPGVQEHVDYGVRILDSGESLDGIAAAPTAFNGTKLARFLRKVGDPGNVIGAPYRSEFHYSNHLREKRRRAYRFMTYHGSPGSSLYWKIGTSQLWRVWWQIHPNTGSPMLSLESGTGDRFKILRRAGTSTSKSDLIDVTDAMLFDAFNEWIVDMLHSTGTDGFIHIWLNGTQIVNLNNVRTVPVSDYVIYPKQGLYHSYTSSVGGLAFGDDFAIADSDNLTDDLFAFLHQVPSGPGVTPESVAVSIASDADDVQVWNDGTNYSTGGNYNPVRSSSTVGGVVRNAGLRFASGIPQGAVCAGFKLRVTPYATNTDDADLVILGVDEDAAGAWSASRKPYASGVDGVVLTSASVPWSAVSLGASTVESPDITSIVQAIVDRPGFDGTVALVLRGNDSGLNRELGIENYGTGRIAAELVGTYIAPEAQPSVVHPFPFEVTWTGAAPTVSLSNHQQVHPGPFAVTWAGAVPTVVATNTAPTPGFVTLGVTSARVYCTSEIGGIAMERVQIGTIVTLTGRFTGLDGKPADPTTVSCMVRTPSGTVTSPAVSQSSTGVYTVSVRASESGEWWYRWEGDGAVEVSDEQPFTVLPSKFSGAA